VAQAARLQLRGVEAFALGALAKALATVLTYPLQLAQSKLRAASSAAAHKKVIYLHTHIVHRTQRYLHVACIFSVVPAAADAVKTATAGAHKRVTLYT
jgi:hypothetical protein